MTPTKSTPLPRNVSCHPLCLHNDKGWGDEQLMNEQDKMEGPPRRNAISNGSIKSAALPPSPPAAPSTENNHDGKGNRKESRAEFHPSLASPRKRQQWLERAHSPRQRGTNIWDSSHKPFDLREGVSPRDTGARHQPLRQRGLHAVGSDEGSQGVVLRGGDEARGGIVTQPPSAAEGDVNGLAAGMEAADRLEAQAVLAERGRAAGIGAPGEAVGRARVG